MMPKLFAFIVQVLGVFCLRGFFCLFRSFLFKRVWFVFFVHLLVFFWFGLCLFCFIFFSEIFMVVNHWIIFYHDKKFFNFFCHRQAIPLAFFSPRFPHSCVDEKDCLEYFGNIESILEMCDVFLWLLIFNTTITKYIVSNGTI